MKAEVIEAIDHFFTSKKQKAHESYEEIQHDFNEVYKFISDMLVEGHHHLNAAEAIELKKYLKRKKNRYVDFLCLLTRDKDLWINRIMVEASELGQYIKRIRVIQAEANELEEDYYYLKNAIPHKDLKNKTHPFFPKLEELKEQWNKKNKECENIDLQELEEKWHKKSKEYKKHLGLFREMISKLKDFDCFHSYPQVPWLDLSNLEDRSGFGWEQLSPRDRAALKKIFGVKYGFSSTESVRDLLSHIVSAISLNVSDEAINRYIHEEIKICYTNDNHEVHEANQRLMNDYIKETPEMSRFVFLQMRSCNEYDKEAQNKRKLRKEAQNKRKLRKALSSVVKIQVLFRSYRLRIALRDKGGVSEFKKPEIITLADKIGSGNLAHSWPGAKSPAWPGTAESPLSVAFNRNATPSPPKSTPSPNSPLSPSRISSSPY